MRLNPTPATRRADSRWRTVLSLGLLASTCASAVEFGPLSITGFAKIESVTGSDQCPSCQLFPTENKQRIWADRVVYGSPIETGTQVVSLFQPWITFRHDLGKGFKFEAMLSQRWRDGKTDIPGFFYEKNLALSHEDWGSLRVGAMTTRSWSVADYPYGTALGVADVWASSGAGYGLMTRAVRVTSRPMDVAGGDLVVEATYDAGTRGWTKNKPQFLELYALYRRGDLAVDATYQTTRNGTPSAWGHGPFTGLTPFPADDIRLGGSGQSIAMVMARYNINRTWEVSGGIRANRWSGAYAAVTRSAAGQPDQWNEMFNVDWWCKDAQPSRCNVDNPGHPARSVDAMGGVRYRTGPWTAHVGMTFLGQASTTNPSERGQSNWALVNTVGVSRDMGRGLALYGLAGHVRYRQLGLSPMSVPGNAAFTNVDSRVSRQGHWLGAGAVYTF